MLLANSAQIRSADDIMINQRGYAGILLMEAAGTKTANAVSDAYPDCEEFIVLAGPGNNGGDGLVIARVLSQQGKKVTVVYAADPEKYTGDALVNWNALGAIPEVKKLPWGEEAKALMSGASSNVVVFDALLGTGISSEIRGSIAEIVGFVRSQQGEGRLSSVVAVDLPSGLSADTGEVLSEPITAEMTFTFQLPKVCHFVTPAAEYCGEIVVVDIGIREDVVDSLGITRSLVNRDFVIENGRVRRLTEHKGSVGHVLVIGGSINMCGAPAMTAAAVLKSGAGLCTVFTPEPCKKYVFREGNEYMVIGFGDESDQFFDSRAVLQIKDVLPKFDVIAIGPGIGNSEETKGFLLHLMDHLPDVPTIWDADALNILAENPEVLAKLPGNAVLTPHPGEMKRLLPGKKVIERRIESAEEFAKERNCAVVLKGAHSITSLPDGETLVNTTGNPGMATAGSGDVLTGIVAARTAINGIAVGVPEAVFLHGLAGDLAAQKHGMEGVTAGLIADEVGRAFEYIPDLPSYPHQI